jgi:hypothetical protein
MSNSDLQDYIEKLTKKATQAEKSEDALRFSQAACNIANSWSAFTINVLKR